MTYYDKMREAGDLNTAVIRLANLDIVKVEPIGDNETCSVFCENSDELSDEDHRFLDRYFRNRNFQGKLDVFIRFKVLQEGPKVFRPTAVQCRLLEQMKLNIGINEYAQPFKTIIIEYPEDFASTHVIENVDMPEKGPDTIYKARSSKPLASVVHHDAKNGLIFHSLICENYASFLAVYGPKWPTIEEWVGGATYEDEVTMRRIALAYSLVLDEYGVKSTRPQDANTHEELRRATKRRGASKFNALRLLHAQPVLYEINQTPVLARIVKSSADLPGDPTGRKMPPHHRRGHYAMVACGVGRTQRRRVRRPPVFVNGHLFLGDMANTKVTYTHEEEE